MWRIFIFKGVKQKSKRNNYIGVVDFDNNEDPLIKLQQHLKYSKNKRTPKVNRRERNKAYQKNKEITVQNEINIKNKRIFTTKRRKRE